MGPHDQAASTLCSNQLDHLTRFGIARTRLTSIHCLLSLRLVQRPWLEKYGAWKNVSYLRITKNLLSAMSRLLLAAIMSAVSRPRRKVQTILCYYHLHSCSSREEKRLPTLFNKAPADSRSLLFKLTSRHWFTANCQRNVQVLE